MILAEKPIKQGYINPLHILNTIPSLNCCTLIRSLRRTQASSIQQCTIPALIPTPQQQCTIPALIPTPQQQCTIPALIPTPQHILYLTVSTPFALVHYTQILLSPSKGTQSTSLSYDCPWALTEYSTLLMDQLSLTNNSRMSTYL